MVPTATRLAVAALTLLLVLPQSATAYSVLAHEALIDLAWQEDLLPVLQRRFPGASDRELREARAYAYGGSLIQDLGYYPFGSRFFSNLLHYVRSGDFVAALMRQARDPDEYAFALGALAHYAGDTVGHTTVNRAVPLIYPKLARKYGPEVLYADSPARHVMVEFAFDVLQVAHGSFKADVYQDRIGFQVAIPLLERAFRDTYGLELKQLFGDVDLAVGTYRRAVSRVIPDMTRMAWRDKRDEILRGKPEVSERDVVLTMTRRQYEDAYGTNYRKPSLLARIVVVMFKVIPKFGPFRPLAFEPLTPEAERMFLDSFSAARDRYRELLRRAPSRDLTIADVDLDTGRRVARGRNRLADETFDEAVEQLSEHRAVAMPTALLRELNEHYAAAATGGRVPLKKDGKARSRLAVLNAAHSR